MEKDIKLDSELTCKECKTSYFVYEDDLLPGRDSDGYDDYLIFYVRCPHCLKIARFNDTLIPNNIKLKLMKKYSNIASETFSIWNIEYEINKLKLRRDRLIAIKNEELNKRSDNTKLFNDWIPSEKIIYNDKKLMKKIS